MGYNKTGPFTNGTNPAINAPFFNSVESFLVTLNSASYDNNISSSGGTLQVKAISPTHGSITRIAFGFAAVTTGGTTVTHSLGAVPAGIFVCPAGVSTTYHIDNYGSTSTMTITVGSNCNVWWLVIA